MIRQRKQPNAKEAKTLKVMSEFKRSGLGSWKTSGDRYGSANAAATDYPDKEVMQALVTVGALMRRSQIGLPSL